MLPLKSIDKLLPQKGKIIDLGCGEGIIASFLARNQNRQITGVDINIRRLPSTSEKNLRFEKADIRNYNLKSADGVVLSDVLHHINYSDQEKVLKNIASNLKSGGVLIIKEIDNQEFFRSKLSRFWDFVFYQKEKIYFQTAKNLKNKLQKLGLKVFIERPCRLFPGSTTLLVCHK